MNKSQYILIAGGLILAITGMSYGLYYALFDEHQTLTQIGTSLGEGFSQAAKNDPVASQKAIESYGRIRIEYLREVHTHSHLISLGMLLTVMGVAFHLVALGERSRTFLAFTLLTGAVIFPLGAFLQIFHLGVITKILSITGTILLIGGLVAVICGLCTPLFSGRDSPTGR